MLIDQPTPPEVGEDNYHAPQMQILHGYIVICRGPQCGIIGVRETREQAEAIRDDHKRTHNEVNDRIKAVLEREQAKRAVNAMAQVMGEFHIGNDILAAVTTEVETELETTVVVTADESNTEA